MSVIMATRGGAIRRPDIYTKLLLRGDGAGTTIKDMCGKAASPQGNVTQTTSKRKFIGGSVSYDGSADYINFNDSDDFYFGTGDFTWEGWFYFNARPGSGAYMVILGQYDSSWSYWWGYYFETGYGSNGYRMYCQSTQVNFYWAMSIELNTWIHLAVCRNGNNFYGFKNGNLIGNAQVDADPLGNSTGNFRTGHFYPLSTNYCFNGYMDELRVSKGIARYTASFTPKTRRF